MYTITRNAGTVHLEKWLSLVRCLPPALLGEGEVIRYCLEIFHDFGCDNVGFGEVG